MEQEDTDSCKGMHEESGLLGVGLYEEEFGLADGEFGDVHGRCLGSPDGECGDELGNRGCLGSSNGECGNVLGEFLGPSDGEGGDVDGENSFSA